ncbi:hypothetical protein EfmAA290_16030 [Enterococcus faecium]|nr:hypothetical protein EfmAA290_16030 [Enterococcus faecium]
METVRLWIFMKNFRSALRYVILESKSGYYLIDTDHYTFWGGYLFPIFNWIIPHKVMKINLPAEEINRLILNKDLQRKREKEHSNVAWIGPAFAVVTSSIVGPLPVMAALEKLTTDDLVRILTEPKNALVKQYQKLLSLDNTELEFEPEALRAIAKKAIERNTGARGLRSIIEEIMMDVMFDIRVMFIDYYLSN